MRKSNNLIQEERFENIWINQQDLVKEQIKQALVASLVNPSSVVRSGISQCIAAIAKIELPRKQWMDLIHTMASNATHTNPIVRQASLQTLSYISDDVDADDITPDQKNQIVLAMTSNIIPNSEDEQVKKCNHLGIKGLFSAIPYLSQNFKVQAERDFIMAKIFEILHDKDEDVRVTAMQTLVEIGRQEYESVEYYLQQICEVTYNAVKNDE